MHSKTRLIATATLGTLMPIIFTGCLVQRTVRDGGGELIYQEPEIRNPLKSDEQRETEIGVIMGNRKGHRLFQHLLPGENDGTVRVEGGRLPGLRDFTTVNASHVFMPVNAEVAESPRTCRRFQSNV